MECPHCHEQGITTWAKLLAGTALPAKCKVCGKSSSMPGWVLGAMGGFAPFIFWWALIASLYYYNWQRLIISLIIFVSLGLCMVKWAPLIALSEKQVDKNRKFLYVFLAIMVLLVVFAGLIHK